MSYQHFATVDAAELWERIEAGHTRFVSLLRRVGPDAAVAGSKWSAGEVAGHVLTVLHRYTKRDVRSTDGLAAAVGDIATANDLELGRLTEGFDAILGRIGDEIQEIRRLLPADDLQERLPFHAGTTIDVAGALANILGELVIHGLDVARGSRVPYRVETPDALLVLNALVQIAPEFLRSPRPMALGFRVPGGRPWSLRIGPDGTESRPIGARDTFDVVVRAPAPTLLRSFYQRDSMSRSLLGGMFVVGGRRPWRVLELRRLLPRV